MPDGEIKRVRVELPEETVQVPEYSFDETEGVLPVPEAQDGFVEQPETPKNELADLFEVPQSTDNDMEIDDLFEVGDDDDIDDLVEGGEDLSDLTEVSREDVMGRPRQPRQPKMRFRRTSRPYNPPMSLGGIR